MHRTGRRFVTKPNSGNSFQILTEIVISSRKRRSPRIHSIVTTFTNPLRGNPVVAATPMNTNAP